MYTPLPVWIELSVTFSSKYGKGVDKAKRSICFQSTLTSRWNNPVRTLWVGKHLLSIQKNQRLLFSHSRSVACFKPSSINNKLSEMYIQLCVISSGLVLPRHFLSLLFFQTFSFFCPQSHLWISGPFFSFLFQLHHLGHSFPWTLAQGLFN